MSNPYLDHIRKMLPYGDDADILLAYLAACVQHQGTKFAWCPVLQGVQGNGKSLVVDMLVTTIGRTRAQVMRGRDVSRPFNGWLSANTVTVVEENHPRDMVRENIGRVITSETTWIERRFALGDYEDVRCNFLIVSNHRGTPFDPEECFAPFFCAQKTNQDLLDHGLTPGYFKDLGEWIRADGEAIVADYLRSYNIPDHLNPAARRAAPHTTSFQAAIELRRPRGRPPASP